MLQDAVTENKNTLVQSQSSWFAKLLSAPEEEELKKGEVELKLGSDVQNSAICHRKGGSLANGVHTGVPRYRGTRVHLSEEDQYGSITISITDSVSLFKLPGYPVS